jgi:hypothetical protein
MANRMVYRIMDTNDQQVLDARLKLFAAVRDRAWGRTGTRSDGARSTVESFARYFIHDPVHHLYDVTGKPAAIGRPET